MESLFVPLAFLAFPLTLGVVGAVLAWRASQGRRRRTLLLGFGVTLIAVPVVFFALMLSGETIAELGVGRGLALIGPWALAAAALVILAATRPDLTLRLLAVLAIVPLGVGVWSAVGAAGFGAWLDRVGPMNLLVTYLLITSATVVAVRRPRAAGLLIVLIAFVPAVLPLLVAGEGQSREWIIAALSAPPVIAAALMILAGTPAFVDPARARDRSGSGPTPTGAGRDDRPMKHAL